MSESDAYSTMYNKEQDAGGLNAKVCIVTGGSMGIGLACCEIFAKDGFQVYNIDVAPIRKDVPNVTTKLCDVSNIANLEKCFAEIFKETNDRCDVLVSNAGIWQCKEINEVSEEEFDKFVGINIKGSYFSIRAVTPIMKKQMSGSIVIMCSDQSFVGKENQQLYGLTKGALGILCKSTAQSMAKYNVTCNGICPGTIDTPLVDYGAKDLGIEDVAEFRKMLGGLQPIKRLGMPEEVAQCVKFTTTQPWMTGSLVPLDGGYTCG